MIRSLIVALLEWILGKFNRQQDRSKGEQDAEAAEDEQTRRIRAQRAMEQLQDHLLDQPVDYDRRDELR